MDFGDIRPILDVSLVIAVFTEVFSLNVIQTQADVCVKWVMRVENVISVDLVIMDIQLASLVSVMLQERLKVNVVEKMGLVLAIQLRDNASVSLILWGLIATDARRDIMRWRTTIRRDVCSVSVFKEQTNVAKDTSNGNG